MADALIEAMRAGKLAAVRAALKADPAAARHARPIVEAGRLAFQPAAELLHRRGADLNASWKGYRPLHALLQEKPHGQAKPSPERLACLDWLLKHGASADETGAWPPARAIIIAAFMGEPKYAARLRRAGARMDGFAAAALGDLQGVAEALRQNPNLVHERDRGGLTMLQCACGSRMRGSKQVEITRLLLDAGADVRALTKSWLHELDAAYYAAGSGDPALFSLLLERGADATQAVVHAVWGKRFELAQLALDHGARLDSAVHENRPLLNNLIRWGQIPQTLWMLDHGASPNLPDSEGFTAVHQAAQRGNARMLEAVLAAGGDLARRDRRGHTPIDVARANRRNKLAALMALAFDATAL